MSDIYIVKDKDHGFIARSKAFTSFTGFGETKKEAIKALKEIIKSAMEAFKYV